MEGSTENTSTEIDAGIAVDVLRAELAELNHVSWVPSAPTHAVCTDLGPTEESTTPAMTLQGT